MPDIDATVAELEDRMSLSAGRGRDEDNRSLLECVHAKVPSLLTALRERTEALDEARGVIEGLIRQFGGWNDAKGGFDTMCLSALEEAFDFLGWEDPHPAPESCCDEPGCTKQASCGWPQKDGPYRRTCHVHYRSSDELGGEHG